MLTHSSPITLLNHKFNQVLIELKMGFCSSLGFVFQTLPIFSITLYQEHLLFYNQIIYLQLPVMDFTTELWAQSFISERIIAESLQWKGNGSKSLNKLKLAF